MEFPAGFAEAVLMLHQGKIIADSNESRITRIYSFSGREKRIFIFETSNSSEKTFSTFSELRTFCEYSALKNPATKRPFRGINTLFLDRKEQGRK
jgi:hypothetical protein